MSSEKKKTCIQKAQEIPNSEAEGEKKGDYIIHLHVMSHLLLTQLTQLAWKLMSLPLSSLLLDSTNVAFLVVLSIKIFYLLKLQMLKLLYSIYGFILFISQILDIIFKVFG